MSTLIPSIDAEPPLIAQLRRAVHTAKRTLWLWKKLSKPFSYRMAHFGLAGILLVSLNPFTSAHALAASELGTEAPSLAEFSFSSYEEVSLQDELAQIQADGFAPKPVVVTTEMGRPEREQRDRASRAAAARAKAARAQAAQRARVANTPSDSTGETAS